MTTGKAWTIEEIEIICNVYAKMLHAEIMGMRFNKSERRRACVPLLDGRSAGSYEMKCCNISAACADLNLPWINGYKPMDAYQAALRPAILAACAKTGIHPYKGQSNANQ